MDIESIQSNAEIQALLRQQGIDPSQLPEPPAGKQGPPPMGPPPDMMETTQMGSLLSSLSEMDEDTASSIQDFGEKVAESIRSGTFDAEALAESAPEELIQLAEEQGIDLSEALAELFTQAQQMKDSMGYGHPQGPPPPPPMNEDETQQAEELLMAIQSEDDETA